MKEIWKETNIKGLYVSNLGNLYQNGEMLKKIYKFDFNGYCAIQVFNKTYYIHRLVAQAFIDNPLNKPCVNHIDGNKQNNCVNNLEWVSYSENNKHAYKIGLKIPNESTNKHKSVCMLNDKKEIVCIFPKQKNAEIVFGKNIRGNIIRAIKTNTKCNGYYWEYYYDNDINLKVNK